MPLHVTNIDEANLNHGCISPHEQAMRTMTRYLDPNTAIASLQTLPSVLHVEIIHQILNKAKQDFLDDFTGPPPMHPPFRSLVEEAEYVLAFYLAASPMARRCWRDNQQSILSRVAKARMATLSIWRRQLRVQFIRAKARYIFWRYVLQNRPPGIPNLVDYTCRAWEEYTHHELLLGLTEREFRNSAKYLAI
jgi:hypothetical protein